MSTGHRVTNKPNAEENADATPQIAVFSAVCWLITDGENRPPEIANVDTERLSAANTDEPGNWLSHGRGWDEKCCSPLAEVAAKTVSMLGLS
jgi:hypothetical protein